VNKIAYIHVDQKLADLRLLLTYHLLKNGYDKKCSESKDSKILAYPNE